MLSNNVTLDSGHVKSSGEIGSQVELTEHVDKYLVVDSKLKGGS